MNMKLAEVNKHLLELSTLGNMTFPIKLSYAMAYNQDALSREAERIDAERKKLCERYADKDGEGKPIMADSVLNGKNVKENQITSENRKKFEEEYATLLNTDVDMDIRTVGMDEIEKCDQADKYSVPTVAQLAALSFMIQTED